jgi:4-hydroxy-2-oxoheptanedioate aldolase
MIENLTKSKLQKGETVYGIFASNTDDTQAELLAMLGWDFIVFDGEHNFLEAKEVGNLSRTCELHKVTPIVRMPGRHPQTVNRFMDAGAHGAIFPMINSGAEVEEVIQTMKYPPRGKRGLAAPRAADFGLTAPLDEYIQKANRETLVAIQVETREAINSLDEILGIADIDVVFVGPTDLSTNMGLCGQLDHPEVKEAIAQVANKVVNTSGKELGIYVKDSHSARYYHDDLGAKFIATGVSFLIAKGSKIYLENLKGKA